LLLPVIVSLKFITPIYFAPNIPRFEPHPLRLRSDEQVNNLQIQIVSLDYSNVHDPGGWMIPPLFRKPGPRPPNRLDNLIDFGELNVKQLSRDSFVREIDSLDEEKYDQELKEAWERMDADPTPFKYYHDDELDYVECRRPKWKEYYFPTCNAFHEVDMTRNYDVDLVSSRLDPNFDSYLFSHGYYRDAFLVEDMVRREATVLKVLRFKHEYTTRIYNMVQRDAIVMERLTSSDYIVNMHGHCASSLMVEPISYELEEYVVPQGYMKQEELLDQYDVNPQNDYTVIEKLEVALAMAESLAVLHGFKDGIIVHDDVQLCQWLRTRDNRLVLGDFNRAEVMDWNDEKQEYCMYNNGFAYGNYRSPEEFNGKDLNEKIDIFSYGNNVYGLLTGLWPFYENEDDDFVQRQIIDGKTSYIDDRYRERSYGEGKMVNLIEQCWQFKPEDRPDIFEIVRFLRRALEEEKFREGIGQQQQQQQQQNNQ